MKIRIAATAALQPAHHVTSEELDARFGRTPGTTRDRSGVASRAWASGDETTTSMGAEALTLALTRAGWDAASLDALVHASAVPEQLMPTSAVLTARRLGLEGAACFDVNASCLSVIQALEVLAPHVESGRWGRVAIVASEVASVGICHDDVETSGLFGDGAAALLLEPAPAASESALLACRTVASPGGAHLTEIRGGGTRFNVTTPPPSDRDYLFRMNGPAVFKHSMRVVPLMVERLLAEAGVRREDLAAVIPHQASGLGLRYVKERLGFHPDQVVDVLADHGNQVAASLPTALDAAVSSGRLTRGGLALLIGSGAGLVVGGAVVRW